MMNEQKILTPALEARVHQAVDNFMQGYGCCQSVVAAFADLYEMCIRDRSYSDVFVDRLKGQPYTRGGYDGIDVSKHNGCLLYTSL